LTGTADRIQAVAAGRAILRPQRACTRAQTVVPEAARRVQAGAPGRCVQAAAGAVGRHEVLEVGGQRAVGGGECARALALRVLFHFNSGALLVADT